MDAREEVKKYYRESDRFMHDEIEELFINRQGVVVWTENCCILARMVDTSEPVDAWSYRLWEVVDNPDAWYIHVMAGDIKTAIELAKKVNPLPYVVFQRGLRNDKVHRIPMNKLLKNKDKI